MNEQKESKSLGRLVANLESDPDIQAAIQAERAAQGLAVENSSIEPLKQQVFQIVQNAMACYEDQHKSSAPAEWLRDVLEQIGERANRFRQGFVSQVVALVDIPASGFVRTAPVLGNVSGEALQMKSVYLGDYLPAGLLREYLPWIGDSFRISTARISKDSSEMAFSLSVDVRDKGPSQKGELWVAIKFRSETRFVPLSRMQPATALDYFGSERLDELAIQLFAAPEQ